MKNILTILTLILITSQTTAQFVDQHSINAQIGYGLSAPYESVDDIADDGFFLQGEYVVQWASWAKTIAYTGVVLTSSNGKDLNNNPTNELAESKAFLLGTKARVRAPIPWVAPYVELGIGASIGKFRTFTSFVDINKSGVIYHIPVSLGLELGRNHGVDIGLAYYFQPTVEQFAGAATLGVSIPLKTK
ncbi:hypothetical protein [Flagellimonas sp.]|uniref:hypothetical protein n=1 Tax=Flagellimonas sp. TaxID=2058762 RepID=UPI003B5091CC